MKNVAEFVRSFKATVGANTDMPDEFWPVLAEHLEDAMLTHSREELEQLSDALSELWDSILLAAPESVTDAVLHNKKSNELTSYLLGKIGFASLFTMQLAEKRVHETFMLDMQSDIYKNYIDALAKGEMTGRELATIVNETEESVSRKLKVLREMGITDYRVIGTSRRNFLTPSARAIANSSLKLQEAAAFDNSKNKILEQYKNDCLTPIMKASQSFASVTLQY